MHPAAILFELSELRMSLLFPNSHPEVVKSMNKRAERSARNLKKGKLGSLSSLQLINNDLSVFGTKETATGKMGTAPQKVRPQELRRSLKKRNCSAASK